MYRATKAVQGSPRPPVALTAVGLLVQKFGGTSVADPDRIRAVADHLVRTRRDGSDVVAVVSAMGKTTDNLVRLANDVARTPGGREMDMLLTSGERISMALLSMAVEDLGQPAVSFTGSQAGILTDTEHGKAKIIEVRGDRISFDFRGCDDQPIHLARQKQLDLSELSFRVLFRVGNHDLI